MNSIFLNQDMIALVPVRAGSKGLPGKNCMDLNGLPLYEHAINQGLRTVGQVVLSTDIKDISNKVLPHGCEFCRRPTDLAADDTPMEDVIRYVITKNDLFKKTVILLQATSPLRADIDIYKAIELFKTSDYDMVLSVVKKDRSVLKYGSLEGSTFTSMRNNRFCFFNRQELPEVYGPNGAVYVFKADKFLELNGFPSKKIGAIEMPMERSTDIDSRADLDLIRQSFKI